MLHLRSFTGFSIHFECLNAFRLKSNKFFNRFNQISSERKNILDIQVCVLSKSSTGRPESTSQGRPLNVR